MHPALKQTNIPIILASGSTYKRELLSRLQFKFSSIASDINETIKEHEDPASAAKRLAREKAEAVKEIEKDKEALIIGCDQIAFIKDGKEKPFLGKPGSRENAYQQLSRSSGQRVYFYTAIYLLHTRDGYIFEDVDHTLVRYRELSHKEIEDYLDRENALDCAGSAKIEALGISLLESIESKDPTALIGLPLITLNKQLIKFIN